MKKTTTYNGEGSTINNRIINICRYDSSINFFGAQKSYERRLRGLVMGVVGIWVILTVLTLRSVFFLIPNAVYYYANVSQSEPKVDCIKTYYDNFVGHLVSGY